jgi:hypothetical protein
MPSHWLNVLRFNPIFLATVSAHMGYDAYKDLIKKNVYEDQLCYCHSLLINSLLHHGLAPLWKGFLVLEAALLQHFNQLL